MMCTLHTGLNAGGLGSMKRPASREDVAGITLTNQQNFALLKKAKVRYNFTYIRKRWIIYIYKYHFCFGLK